MNNLIIIPARKNSIRLKNKNILKLKNLTLIEHTINFAKEVMKNSNILVSTDSEKIQSISLKNKVLCPWLRPSYLSKSNSSTEAVILHALKWYEKSYNQVDFVILLQPTSPFRTKKSYNNCISLAIKNPKSTIITFKEKKNTTYTYLNSEIKLKKKKLIVPNGNLFIISSKKLKKKKQLYSGSIKPYLIKSNKENIDIDNEKDFVLAKKLY